MSHFLSIYEEGQTDPAMPSRTLNPYQENKLWTLRELLQYVTTLAWTVTFDPKTKGLTVETMHRIEEMVNDRIRQLYYSVPSIPIMEPKRFRSARGLEDIVQVITRPGPLLFVDREGTPTKDTIAIGATGVRIFGIGALDVLNLKLLDEESGISVRLMARVYETPGDDFEDRFLVVRSSILRQNVERAVMNSASMSPIVHLNPEAAMELVMTGVISPKKLLSGRLQSMVDGIKQLAIPDVRIAGKNTSIRIREGRSFGTSTVNQIFAFRIALSESILPKDIPLLPPPKKDS